MLERVLSVSVPASIIGPYQHQVIKTWEMALSRCWGGVWGGGVIICITAVPRVPYRDQITAATQYKRSNRKLPLLSRWAINLSEKGGSVGHPVKQFPFHRGSADVGCTFYWMLWIAMGILVSWRFVQNKIKCKKVIPDTLSSCPRSRAVREPRAAHFPTSAYYD